MFNLTDPQVIKTIMNKFGANFKKGFGQNFLIDATVLDEIVKASGTNENTGVIEIGPGIGVLTCALAKHAKKVVTIEVDRDLLPILEHTLSDCDNVKVINADVLKIDLNELIEEEFAGMDVVVAANLPYYITTPILSKILEDKVNVKSLTLMVQQEVAKRFCSDTTTKDYGAITLMIQYYASPRIVVKVPARSFMPSPKVDSAVISMKVLSEPAVSPLSEKAFFRLIRASFNQRRKTFLNGICNSSMFDVTKGELTEILKSMEINENIRGEKLTIEQFCVISDELYKIQQSRQSISCTKTGDY